MESGPKPALEERLGRVGGDSTAFFVRRTERKYAVGVAAAAFLKQEIAAHLPVFEFHPGRPETFITTVYFDTKALEFYKEAERHYDDHFKLRAKEYFYLLPNGAEPERFQQSPNCFLELKELAGGTVIKKRLCLPKASLSQLLRGEDVWPVLLTVTSPQEVEAIRAIYDELRGFLRTYAVQPSSVVSYRRQVHQSPDGQLRITFDDEIAVYRPVMALYEEVPALSRDVLGSPIFKSERIILEIKSPGDLPEWLQIALRNHSSRRLSKFTTSVRILTKPLPNPSAPCETQGEKEKSGEEGEKNRLGEDTKRFPDSFF